MDLDTVLSPLTSRVFLDAYFGQTFLHVPGYPEKFGALATDRELIQRLSQQIELALEAPVRVSEVDNSPGVALNRRERDGILLQVGGTCNCRVHAGDGEKAKAPPAFDGPLGPGDAIYIPRGWWLSVAPGGGQVILDIRNPTGADLLDWIVEYVKKHEAFLKDVPRFADPGTKADYATGLRKIIGRSLRAPSSLEGFRRATNFSAQPQPGLAAPWTEDAAGDRLIAILAPRKIRIRRADEKTILLVTMGKRMPFPEDAAPLLHFLSDRAPVPLADFYAAFAEEFDREELSDFLSVLNGSGIIGLLQPHSS